MKLALNELIVMIVQMSDTECAERFVSIATIPNGLSRICQQHGISLIDMRDDFDQYRYACLNVNSVICVLESYPRYYPESFDLCLPAGLENARRLAESVLLALSIRLDEVKFHEAGYNSYPVIKDRE